jgi:hypothetical protein
VVGSGYVQYVALQIESELGIPKYETNTLPSCQHVWNIYAQLSEPNLAGCNTKIKLRTSNIAGGGLILT